VQISSRLFGFVYHADGVARRVRNDIYQGRPAERYYDALDWLFSAPGYVRDFR
jgi:salicylate hydroxylase